MMRTAKIIAELVEAGHKDLASQVLAANPDEDYLYIPLNKKPIYSFDELTELAEQHKDKRVKEQHYTSAKVVKLSLQILGSDVKLVVALKVKD